jgi:hypothetical protein
MLKISVAHQVDGDISSTRVPPNRGNHIGWRADWRSVDGLNDIPRHDPKLRRGRIFLHGGHAHSTGTVDAQCHAKCASTWKRVGLSIGLGTPHWRRHDADDGNADDSEV